MSHQDSEILPAAPANTKEPVGVSDSLPEPMNAAAARAAVIREVASWQGVRVEEHRFGGVAFRMGRRELGHVHGSFADLPFPLRLRDELVAAGRARPHHILPESGWVTVPMRTAGEMEGVIALFRQNYDRARQPSATPDQKGDADGQ
jgi:hypothetical protein